ITVKEKTKVKNAVSYQIYYSTNSKFKSKKTATVKTSKKLSSLKKSTKYYVKARAVTKINGKKYYSKWSKVVSKKTK
ncbi:MAG: subtilase, partial [Clostridia bacterium]|nr:subtilase [Clostridia bacterium]